MSSIMMGKPEADGKRQASQSAAASSAPGVSSETHLAWREWRWMPSLWREAGPPAAHRAAQQPAGAVGHEKKIDSTIRPATWSSWSSTTHFKSFVQHLAASSSSSSSLLSSHSWASTISIRPDSLRKNKNLLRKAKKNSCDQVHGNSEKGLIGNCLMASLFRRVSVRLNQAPPPSRSRIQPRPWWRFASAR